MTARTATGPRMWNGRQAAVALIALLALLGAALAPGGRVSNALAQSATTRPLASRVVSVAMTVADADRSVEFYSRVLGFEKLEDVEIEGPEYDRLQGVFGLRARVVRMQLGAERIELWEYLAPRGRPVPADSRSHDRWFQHIAIVVSDMDRAYAWLRRHRVTHASSGPQRLPDWNAAAGGIRAFYFKDPDDHVLEAIWFPPGKGDARWQAPGDRLFLGIDHTAIVVRETEESLRFYEGVLGLTIAGGSENHGPEQERLNHVFGARLRITTLRAAGGPGVELLEYLTPRDGRAYPADARANDLVHWQVRLQASDTGAAERAFRGARTWLVSPGLVSLPGAALGFRRGLLVRDPNGHALQVTGD